MHVETNDDWDSPRELTPPAPVLTESNVQEKKPKKKKSIFWSIASNSSNAGASDSGLSDDGEGSSRAGAGGASKSHRLKFSKGKKLHKSMSQAYMKQLNAAKGSKFANWTKAELVELLIHHHIGDESDGIHIRNEANIDVVVLRDMADELFEGKDPPPKPRLPGLEEVVLKNVMARRIQDAWVEYQYAKRERVEMHRSMYYRDQVRRIESHQEVDKIGKAELLYMSLGGGAGDIEQGGNDMILTEDQDAANLVLNESFLLQDRTQLDELERRYEAKSNEPGGPLVSSQDSQDQKKRQNVLDLPWQPPNIERAQRYADYVQPRKGGKGGKLFDYFNTTTGRHCCLGSLGEQFDLWEEGRISEFSIYGPGVTNYFKFIKFALWLFLLLTVLSLPMLALNSVPDNKDDEIGLKQLASTTIGNLAVTQVNGTLSIDVPGCDSFALLGSTCRFDGKDLSLLYSVLDIIISCVVFIGFIWLSLFEQYEEIELNRSTIKASMYTIVVSNLPPDVTEVDLLNHFGSIVGRKDAISCISLAYNNEDEIELCKKRGDIIRKKIILVHEHRRDCTRLNGRTDLSEEDKNVRLVNDRNAFFEKMKKLNQDLSSLEKQLEELSKEELGVVYAYITFNKSTDRDIAYDAYHKNTLYAYLFNKTKRLLLNNQLLVVNHAPEPSVILWENLQYSYYERWKRRGVTIILSLFFIIITLAMIFSSKYLQEKASNNGYKSASVCPGDFTTWTITEQQNYVDQNPSYLHCYCDQYDAIAQADDSYCKSYLQDTINSQVLMYFASFIVLVVNALITYIFKIYVMYEKHHTSDGQGISIFFRLFVLKYINTACVFLINNNNVILRSIFNIHISSAPSFTAKWYNSVGVTIILVQLGDIITGNLDGIIKCITYYSRRYRAFNNPESLLTQEQLNKQFVGPEFEFAFNYAQIMATLFVTLTFSTGIPLLYPIAAANFCLSYWIEKFLFINVYKIPPHFNTVVGRRASGLIPIAILIHIAVAIWMLSNKSIFTDEIATNNESLAEYYYSSSSSGQSAGDITFNARRRVTEEATLPLFILFFIILFIWIFMYITQFVTIGLERFYTFYLGCTTNEENRESNAGALKAFKKAQENVTYVRAVKRNLIKGLATYNILQNPAYKEAFGITWKFAIDHHDVRSIRKHKLRAQHSEFEDNADEIESLQRSALAHSLPHKIHHVHTEQPTSSSTGPPPTIASRRTKRPSHSETGSAASEASRLSYKSVTKNRSFYGSFYEQQKSEQIILQIDKQKEFQNLMKQDRKGRTSGSSTDKKKRREKRSGGARGGGDGATSPPPPPPSAISPTPASAIQERRKGKSSDKSPGSSGRSKSRHPPPVTLKQSHHPMAGRPLPSSNPTSPQPSSSSRNNYAPVPVVAEAHAINAEAIDPNHFDIEMRPNPFDPRIHHHHQQYYPGAAQHPPPPVQYVPMTGGSSAISSPTTSGSYAGALGGAFPQQYPSRGGEHRHLHRPRQGQPKPHQYY